MLSSVVFIRDGCPKLVGQIEYCSPEERSSNVFGSFKLKNDPKAIRITDENILYCGSKLLGAEVIGLVLYTGQDTKVFQQNTTQNLRGERPSRYKTILVCISMSLLMGIVSAVYRLIQPRQLALVSVITGRSKLAVIFLTIIDCLIFQLHQGSPLLFLFIVEIANHFRHHSITLSLLSKPLSALKSALRSCLSNPKPQPKKLPDTNPKKDAILNTKKPSDFKLRAETNPEQQQEHKNNPRFADRLEDSGIDSAGMQQSQKSSPTTPRRSIIRQQSVGVSLAGQESVIVEGEYSENSSGTGGNTAAGSLNSQNIVGDGSWNKEKGFELTQANPDRMKSLSFGLPYSCALSDTVIFDKTDTLTAARLKISRISTANRDYSLLEDGSPDTLELMLEDSRRNALKYLLSEEDEEEEHESGFGSDESSRSHDDGSESSQQ